MKGIVLLIILSMFGGDMWLTDYQTASEKAKAESKPILLVFSGSDWCRPCIKMDLEVWDQETFKALAEKDLVLLKADFPKLKKNQLEKDQLEKNSALAEQYNKQGQFPWVVLLTSDGKVLDQFGYLTEDQVLARIRKQL